MRRRIFLKSIASAVALTSVAAQKAPKPIPFNRDLFSILLGPAFDGQAELSIVHSRSERIRYIICDGEQILTDASYETITYPGNSFRIDKFLVKNLPIDTPLTLRVYGDDIQIDERTFSSISSQRNEYAIGLASCMRAAQHDKSIWASLEQQKTDLLLFLGDCVYVDYNLEVPLNPKILWEKFVETRMVLHFYHWKKLVPTIAIWDDHDFGGDNSNRTFPFVKETQTNFKNFFAQNLSEGSFITPGPGIACRFQLGNQLFLMLDGRSFRDAPKSGQLYSMFGKEQEDWIFDSINNFDGLVWLNNGTQWFNLKGYSESFRKQHTINFNMFVEKLNQANKNVIFTSGDIHFSEICETPKFLKNLSLEITSSCMHSSTFVGLPAMNRSENRRGATSQINYIVSHTQQHLEDEIKIDNKCYTRNRRLLFTTQMTYNLNKKR
ncbi:MAG: hypothetical protein JNL11_15755 [Bdellovibrionaceae bacterium]|nr:hypothetical protein [Pseudobdellovibrionaceae bacterium]